MIDESECEKDEVSSELAEQMLQQHRELMAVRMDYRKGMNEGMEVLTKSMDETKEKIDVRSEEFTKNAKSFASGLAEDFAKGAGDRAEYSKG